MIRPTWERSGYGRPITMRWLTSIFEFLFDHILPIGKTERRPAGTRTSRWSWLVRTLWYRKWLPVSVTNNPERWNAPAGAAAAASHTSQLWMEVHFIPRLEIKQGTFPFAASSSNRIPFLYMCVFKSCWFISHSCIVPSSLSFSIHFNRIHHIL